MNFNNYLSPFSWRYGSDELRKIWSENNKRLLWRKIWVALAEIQMEYGLVNQAQLKDLKAQENNLDIEKSLDIEKEIHHDLMAELKVFSEQCPVGGGVIHLGATSTDIKDNTTVIQIQQSLNLSIDKLGKLLDEFSRKIDQYANLPVMAYTHIQPAEPTTLGYRLAQYGQDLLIDWQELSKAKQNLMGKGIRGAVGTGAAFAELIGTENLSQFNEKLSKKLGLAFYPVTTQTYPRKQDFLVISALAGLGASLSKFAFDLRILQSPPFGELSEPFGKKQVGSSAMPFKRNPVNSEKINSLARQLAVLPKIAWDNAANSLLERTLDDSANRRTMLPEVFLIADELLATGQSIVQDLQVNHALIEKNLTTYGPFASTERLLMALGKKGANRQEMHERIRKHAMEAWKAIQNNQENPLIDLILSDKEFMNYLSKDEILACFEITTHVGDAPKRAKEFAQQILNTLKI